jgi:hypothetical protein
MKADKSEMRRHRNATVTTKGMIARPRISPRPRER